MEVGDAVGVSVAGSVFVGVNVCEGVAVDVDVKVAVGVSVSVGVSVLVGVFEGVAVGIIPEPIRLKASISLPACPHVLPSKYNTDE